MTALETDDLAVVTGPLTVGGVLASYLTPGEVVRVVGGGNRLILDVHGMESNRNQFIDASSLTPLSELHNKDDVKWGDLLDPDYVHDYVWEGDE